MEPKDDYARAINAHYDHAGGLEAAIDRGLRVAGHDLATLRPEDLAAVDQFHLGGPGSTRALLARAGLPQGAAVLDVGGGLGGAARALALEAECRVTVLDLTAAFVRVGVNLTARTGLSSRVRFGQGDATRLPFGAASFDAVWAQHSAMNIPDKGALYGECCRVLRPGGRLALHEVLAGPAGAVRYPVPWARTAALSDLAAPDMLRGLLGAAGLREAAWEDVTAEARRSAERLLGRLAAPEGPPPLGPHLFLGPGTVELMQNLALNLAEGRVTVAQGVFLKE
ncbi:MAG: class I SAM-dependent methyltransferase [Anaerolineales bacterium]|nr:class I SAM-dependent methyltransferase [Anaerolineales bacterium]